MFDVMRQMVVVVCEKTAVDDYAVYGGDDGEKAMTSDVRYWARWEQWEQTHSKRQSMAMPMIEYCLSACWT